MKKKNKFLIFPFIALALTLLISNSCKKDETNNDIPLPIPTVPIITTTAITAITSTTAISGGYITSNGGAAVTASGVCWSTRANPVATDSHTSNNTTTGAFSSSITGLTPYTLYYLRAYASNSAGIAYGDRISFTTYTDGAITDADNNYYNIVTIGTQTWMMENLKTTKYRDGSSIPNVSDGTTWSNQTDGASCWYLNDISYKNTYGELYNWYTVVDSRNLCPAGWHIPTDNEWKTLEAYLGMTQTQVDSTGWRGSDQGIQMKSTTEWAYSGNGTNTSRFLARPGGLRITFAGAFNYVGALGEWWTASDYNASYAWKRTLSYHESNVYRDYANKRDGYSVRCLKDL